MKRKLILSAVLLVVILGLIGGGVWYNSAHPSQTAGNEKHEGGGEHREGGGDKGKENKMNAAQTPAVASPNGSN